MVCHPHLTGPTADMSSIAASLSKEYTADGSATYKDDTERISTAPAQGMTSTIRGFFTGTIQRRTAWTCAKMICTNREM